MAGIGGGILLQQPRAVFIKFNFDGKTAGRFDDLGGDDVGFRQNRIALDGDQHGIGAEHGNGLAGTGGVGAGFNVYAQSAGLRFLGGLTAAGQSEQDNQRQINVESSRQSFHSTHYKNATHKQCKDTYGQTIQQS